MPDIPTYDEIMSAASSVLDSTDTLVEEKETVDFRTLDNTLKHFIALARFDGIKDRAIASLDYTAHHDFCLSVIQGVDMVMDAAHDRVSFFYGKPCSDATPYDASYCRTDHDLGLRLQEDEFELLGSDWFKVFGWDEDYVLGRLIDADLPQVSPTLRSAYYHDHIPPSPPSSGTYGISPADIPNPAQFGF